MRRLLKVLIAAWLVGEWYSRGGREFIFGGGVAGRAEPSAWLTVRVALPVSYRTQAEMASVIGTGIVSGRGDVVGQFVEHPRPEYNGRQWVVAATFRRDGLGWPVHVAVAQAQQMALDAVS